MNNIKWDLKSNYILALTVCKYGSICDCWNRVANDLAFYIKTTPENCKEQFDYLCQEYGQDWEQQSNESLHNYIFSVVKRVYYGDLYARMTESRELLMVMYDFIRLFRCGKITYNDINTILQDVKNSVPSDNSTEYSEQQKKIKMLERLKFHMIQQMSQTPDVQPPTFPVELLPPPPPFLQQQQSLLNDRQVPSIANHLKTNGTELSSFPKIIQTTNLLVDEQNQLNEVELSSDDDNDQPTTNSNHAIENDESTFLSDEQIETNISSNIPPLTNETIDNSLSNPLTDETKFSVNGQSTSSNIPLNTSTNGSNDVATLDSDRNISTTENQRDDSIESQSTDTTPRRISIDDDDVARMDAEQIAETIPTDITNVPLTNDNAVFAVDGFDSNTDQQKLSTIDHKDLTSENNGVVKNKNERQKSRLNYSSTSTNFRKIVNSILSNLKTAKYAPDFTRSLKSFRLSDDYYDRIKNPIDIPEIRERMTNGDYDENFLSFQRDVLLMLTNALLSYDREHDIHGHARYMIDYAMELFTPVDEARNPWRNADLNYANGVLSSIFQTVQRNDTDDDTLNTRTPSIASTSSSSSFRFDSSIANLRRSRTSNHYSMSKRQRKTLH